MQMVCKSHRKGYSSNWNTRVVLQLLRHQNCNTTVVLPHLQHLSSDLHLEIIVIWLSSNQERSVCTCHSNILKLYTKLACGPVVYTSKFTLVRHCKIPKLNQDVNEIPNTEHLQNLRTAIWIQRSQIQLTRLFPPQAYTAKDQYQI
jgi:hypothetical protein